MEVVAISGGRLDFEEYEEYEQDVDFAEMEEMLNMLRCCSHFSSWSLKTDEGELGYVLEKRKTQI